MANRENPNVSSENPSPNRQEITQNVPKEETLFSPRFRSVAAMAGWDEETLLLASFIVEDTPDRLSSKRKKRPDLPNFKTPPSNSRRRRKTPRRSPASIPITVLNLDDDLDASTSVKQVCEEKKVEANASVAVENKIINVDEVNDKKASPSIPCIDRLREELSCAICLEICYEPSTTPCGHSFCMKCLRSAADRCGNKCPKCRQLISNGRYCKVNTVLWNTIQLLFPKEVEDRKKTAAGSESDSPKPQRASSSRETIRTHHGRNRSIPSALYSPESETTTAMERRNSRVRSRNSRPSGTSSSRRGLPNQDEDAALALRLQREEFLGTVQIPDNRRHSLATARDNLRAMASRAISIRVRNPTRKRLRQFLFLAMFCKNSKT